MSDTHADLPARALLERAADMIADFVERSTDRTQPVTRSPSPQQVGQRLKLALPRAGRDPEAVLADLRAVLDLGVLTGHVGFANQLFGGISPIGIAGEWATAALNTSMYTYEVAPVMTLMENQLIARMCELAGFTDAQGNSVGEGTFTPGGSMSNLMAVMLARHRARPGAHADGMNVGRGAGKPLVVFVSDQAHYSLQRACIVLGLGLDAVRSVPATHDGTMDPAELERMVEQAHAEGCQPMMVCATAGTTVLGAYDPISRIAPIAQRFGMWLHVDGAYGGSALLSTTHRTLMAGIEHADSLTWCAHKMMGVPLVCSAILVRGRGKLSACNALRAEYLFHQSDEDSCLDLGDMSLQCGRRVDALKLWLAWQSLGDEGYEARIDRLFQLAAQLRAMIRQREGFRLVRDPAASCNTVFDVVPPALASKLARQGPTPQLRTLLQEANVAARDRQKRSGRFLVNYASVDGYSTFRHVASNPDVRREDLSAMLDELHAIAAGLPASAIS